LSTPKKSYRLRRGLLLGLVLLAILGAAGYLAAPQLLAWYRWRAAQRADDRRDFTAAHALYVKCLEAWPQDVATHLAAARAARRAGLLDEADDQIRICQRLEGDVSEETTLEYTLLEAKRNGLTPAQEK